MVIRNTFLFSFSFSSFSAKDLFYHFVLHLLAANIVPHRMGMRQPYMFAGTGTSAKEKLVLESKNRSASLRSGYTLSHIISFLWVLPNSPLEQFEAHAKS